MRFETSQSTPPHLDRRLQWRMLSFVAMFAVALFLLGTLFDEKPSADWKTSNGTSGSRTQRSLDDIDFNIRDVTDEPLRDDEVIMTRPDSFEAPIERDQKWIEDLAADGNEWAEGAVAREREMARRRIRYNKRWLSAVKDNTVGVRRDESEEFFRLLDHASRVTAEDLKIGASDEISYINLMTEPDRYRGEPLTIDGDLWRLYEFDAGPNNYGFKTLYEAWIFTGDSGNHPYRIVTAQLPSSISLGDNTRLPVRVTGYFLKREGYSSKGGLHVAPLLLAPALVPLRLTNSMPPTDSVIPYVMNILIAIGMALLVTLFAFAFGDRRFRRNTQSQLLSAHAPSFSEIERVQHPSVEEALRHISNEHRHEDLQDEIAASGQNAATVATSVLYRRDPYASVPPPIPAPDLTDEELRRRHVAQANVLQSWTNRQPLDSTAPPPNNTDSSSDQSDQNERRWRLAQQSAEQRELDRILNNLAAESSSSEKIEPSTSDTAYTLNSTKGSSTENEGDGRVSPKLGGTPGNGSHHSTSFIGQESSRVNEFESRQTLSKNRDQSDANKLTRGEISGSSRDLDVSTSFSLGSSKLDEWQREIEQFTDRTDSVARVSESTNESTSTRSSARSTQFGSGHYRTHETTVDNDSETDLDESSQRVASNEVSSSEQVAAARAARTQLQRERFLREQQLRLQEQEDQRRQRERRSSSVELDAQRSESSSVEIDREQERSRSSYSRSDEEQRELSHRERERLEFENRERERIERDRRDRERQERERSERERLERERLDREQLQREKLERERQERELRYQPETSERERDRLLREEQRDREPAERDRERAAKRELERQSDERTTRAASPDDQSDETELTDDERSADTSGRARRGGWGWPRRKKSVEAESSESASVEDSSTGESSLDELTSDETSLADELLENENTSGEEDIDIADDSSTIDSQKSSKKKTGWARYNEERANKKKRRRRDGR